MVQISSKTETTLHDRQSLRRHLVLRRRVLHHHRCAERHVAGGQHERAVSALPSAPRIPGLHPCRRLSPCRDILLSDPAARTVHSNLAVGSATAGKGKPVARRGRKASGLPQGDSGVAGQSWIHSGRSSDDYCRARLAAALSVSGSASPRATALIGEAQCISHSSSHARRFDDCQSAPWPALSSVSAPPRSTRRHRGGWTCDLRLTAE